MAADLITTSAANISATRWSSLKLYNAYRLVVALLLLATQDLLSNGAWLQNASTDFF